MTDDKFGGVVRYCSLHSTLGSSGVSSVFGVALRMWLMEMDGPILLDE